VVDALDRREKMSLGTRALRTFCQTSRELAALAGDARDRSRAVLEEKRAAQAVLKEVLLSSADPALVERGYAVSSGGATYRVRPRRVKPPTVRPTAVNVEPVLKLWEDPEAVKASLESFSGLDPATALVSFVIEAVATQAPPTKEPKWKVEVIPYRPKGDAEDGPPAPPDGTNVDELVDTLLRARVTSLALSKETKELRQVIEEKRDAAAEEVLPQLEALPTEKKVQKINLRDTAGNTEAFYLRIKPPLKPRPKRISMVDYKAALRAAAEDTVKRFCVDAFRLPSAASTKEFGEQLCTALQQTLAVKEAATMEAACACGEQAKQRIALDRVRSARSGTVVN
jgi:hypothetical protein